MGGGPAAVQGDVQGGEARGCVMHERERGWGWRKMEKDGERWRGCCLYAYEELLVEVGVTKQAGGGDAFALVPN